MLYTIANLLVGGVADKKGSLSCVFLDEDGSTFATDRMCLVIVEPCKTKDEEFRVAGVKPVEVRDGGVAVPANLVADTIKGIAKQPMRRAHANAALTQCGPVVELATTKDGISATKNSATRVRSALPKVRQFLRDSGNKKASVCVSLKRLKKIVDTFDKMCGGDDTQPVFVELGEEEDPISLRTQSYLTGQRVMGVVTALQVDEWLKLNKWERGLLNKGVKQKKVMKRRNGGKRTVQRRHR